MQKHSAHGLPSPDFRPNSRRGRKAVGRVRLSSKTVPTIALQPGQREATFFDADFPGYGLRVRAGGSRSWVFQYKIGDQHRRITFGTFPAMPEDKARRIAGELHAKVRLGQDPAGAKQEGQVRAAETFGSILRMYMVEKRQELRPRSLREVERHLLMHAKPLHRLQLGKVDRRAVAARLTEIANASGAVTSNRVRASLHAFFAWAMRQGLVEQNPVMGTGKRQEASRERVLDSGELKAIWHALLDDQYGAIIKLLILSGQRANEIAGLRWSEVLDDRIILPGERTKNARLHSLPLSAPARAILDAQPRRDGRDLIFGRGDGPFSGWSKSKQQLDQRLVAAGTPLPHWTPHDIRRSVATHLGELGVAPHAIEAVLNHVSGRSGVARIYNKSTYEREKHAALTMWGEHLLAMIEGRKAKVIPLHA